MEPTPQSLKIGDNVRVARILFNDGFTDIAVGTKGVIVNIEPHSHEDLDYFVFLGDISYWFSAAELERIEGESDAIPIA